MSKKTFLQRTKKPLKSDVHSRQIQDHQIYDLKVNNHHISTPQIRPSSSTLQFNQYFQNLLSKKDQEFQRIDSPTLYFQLNSLSSKQNNNFFSAMSTPASSKKSKINQHLERKKYQKIKQQIKTTINDMSKKNYYSNSDILQYKQLILSNFLEEFTQQIQKQCIEKGEILRYIWNSMLSMLSQCVEALSQNLVKQQKQMLSHEIVAHSSYQQLIQKYISQQKNFNSKHLKQKSTMIALVNELRFKRKEVNKLYKHQKILLNNINEIKEDNLFIKVQYIDLMSSLQDKSQADIQQLLHDKERIYKCKQTKIYLTNANRRHNKQEIQKDIGPIDEKQLQHFVAELEDVVDQNQHNQHLGMFIESAIENYGIKHDDQSKSIPNQNALKVLHKHSATMNAETQISANEFIANRKKESTMSQITYSDKLTHNLINCRMVQTISEKQKKKIMVDAQVQVNSENMKIIQIKKNLKISRVIEFSNQFQKIVHSNNNEVVLKQRNHKKHLSQLQAPINNSRNSSLTNFMNVDNLSQNQSNLFEMEIEEKEQQKEAQPIQEIVSRTMPRSRFNSQMKSTGNQYFNAKKNINDRIQRASAKQPVIQNRNADKNKIYAENVKKDSPSTNSNTNDPTSPIMKSSTSTPAKSKFNLSENFSKLKSQQQSLKSTFSETGFSIEMTEDKQNFIMQNFGKKLSEIQNQPSYYLPDHIPQESSEGLESLKGPVISETLKKKSALNKRHPSIILQKNVKSRTFIDENEMLLQLYRNKQYKTNKKLKEKVNVCKYKDDFTSVKDNILIIAKDVKDLIFHKEEFLKKSYCNKSVKNMYKILMMTFSKAYDYYNKGILMKSLVHPLYQSFALIYGNINNSEIYKKMVSFIAGLSINKENSILRFFLFFLGLDESSPYSEKVTISELYLCLKLLQKIAIDGKVTLNIESIYTDTSKIKQQLISILRQQKIPEELSKNVQKRVVEQLQRSQMVVGSKNGADNRLSEESNQLKINIYNIIILTIQQVLKCKSNLKESFQPILKVFSEYELTKRIPIKFIQFIFSVWKHHNIDNSIMLASLFNMKSISSAFKVKVDTITIEQFCSLLFQSNLIHLEQLFMANYIKSVYQSKTTSNHIFYFKNIIQCHSSSLNDSRLFQIKLWLMIEDKKKNKPNLHQEDQAPLEKMQKIIFTKYYNHIIEELLPSIIGEGLFSLKKYADL